jgi:CspA family cold shock protein
VSTGTVRSFSESRRYGFIVQDDGGDDLFVHRSNIKAEGGSASLKEGQKVEYEIGQGPKGRPCATNVTPV